MEQPSVKTNSVVLLLSIGYFCDRKSIIEIKKERISDSGKFQEIEAQLHTMNQASEGIKIQGGLYNHLKDINKVIWYV